MKTVEFKTADGRTRYYPAGEEGLPVEPVLNIARFVGWLKNPDIEKKIVSLREKPAHAAETINKHVDTVIAFYDYLMRHKEMENRLSEKLARLSRGRVLPAGAFSTGLRTVNR